MPLLRRPPGIRQWPAKDEVPVLRHDLRRRDARGLRRRAEAGRQGRHALGRGAAAVGRRADGRLHLQELRRRAGVRREHRRDGLPVLRQSHRADRPPVRRPEARLRHSLQARQKGGRGRPAQPYEGQAPAAEPVPQRKPHLRGQGRVCAVLAVRCRRRRPHPLSRDAHPHLERPRL